MALYDGKKVLIYEYHNSEKIKGSIFKMRGDI